ncbi:hypothetical protein BKA62DRAFT_773941 [Auriculariales sp. MPI-PUGE-AT-0066]|nr:hypothetical protein BKA62DRAFT_773941 [Auriculariales sp. MPI-PUGE-AT-0066]
MAHMNDVALEKTAHLLSSISAELARLGWSHTDMSPPGSSTIQHGMATKNEHIAGQLNAATLTAEDGGRRSHERKQSFEDTSERRYPLPDPNKYTDYDKKYPPDKYGEELEPNARLFKVYRDRVTEKDEDLVQGWHEMLNVLLVFAGLFSAVLTALLVESSKLLQPDHTEITAKAVLSILHRLEAGENAGLANITTSFVPSVNARRINGLWLCSLTLALIVSLLAILVKQWLVEYTSVMRSSAGDAKQWAWRHYALRQGLTWWGIEAFISCLAIFLHISLFLFLGGLSMFIRALDPAIFCVVVVMTAMTGGFYIISTIAPLYWAECSIIDHDS